MKVDFRHNAAKLLGDFVVIEKEEGLKMALSLIGQDVYYQGKVVGKIVDAKFEDDDIVFTGEVDEILLL